jgi:hypothetical protein
MRKAATFVGLALGLYLIVRTGAEPFAIDMSDPATYRNDWGRTKLIRRPPGSVRTRRGSSRGHRNVPDPSSFLWARPAQAAWPAVGPQRGTRAGGLRPPSAGRDLAEHDS